jgi:hypothetical protein
MATSVPQIVRFSFSLAPDHLEAVEHRRAGDGHV